MKARYALVLVVALVGAGTAFARAMDDVSLSYGYERCGFLGNPIYVENNGDQPVMVTIRIDWTEGIDSGTRFEKYRVDPGAAEFVGCSRPNMGVNLSYSISGAWYVN
ncbi:MAG TPA: hypothetical protein PLL30_14410 [Candidatus Krumholzibacteria bacterium]|nr:hypothetical protein [Candidatus Krumholzibacteria bacterium]HPD72960.1 hypothetical protein [Candidatus Krumholzibacteria bacterium]HRY41759.1 hypothetical protein [Candidatus Krumholzibacteria bacterium]